MSEEDRLELEKMTAILDQIQANREREKRPDGAYVNVGFDKPGMPVEQSLAFDGMEETAGQLDRYIKGGTLAVNLLNPVGSTDPDLDDLIEDLGGVEVCARTFAAQILAGIRRLNAMNLKRPPTP